MLPFHHHILQSYFILSPDSELIIITKQIQYVQNVLLLLCCSVCFMYS